MSKEKLLMHKAMCKDCPFREDGHAIAYGDYMLDVYQNLLNMSNHACHNDPTHQTVCRGGRDWQLTIAARTGIIEAPTHDALAKAMRLAGVEPSAHILNECKQSDLGNTQNV